MPVHIVGAIHSLVLPDTEPTASILPKKYESTRRVGSKCERLIEIFHVFPLMVARYLEQLILCFCVCDFLIQILTEKMRYVQAPQEYQCHADCFLSQSPLARPCGIIIIYFSIHFMTITNRAAVSSSSTMLKCSTRPQYSGTGCSPLVVASG